MISFSLEIPTRVYFGRNLFKDALIKEKPIIRERALIVSTGGSLDRLGYVDELSRVFGDLAIETILFDRISSNPELDDVKKAIEVGKEFNVNSVIGFGGGSSIDAAKAVACGMACKEPIEEYYYNGLEPEATIPMIAIPTTAGTGSELSKGAILSDEKTKQKKGLRGFNVYPRVSIVDSHFTEQIPYKVTMETGFDVFAHAMESFVSAKANVFSEMLSLKAIKIVGENLTKLTENLNDKEARENMSYASMIMGINLGNTGTALPHRLQYPVSVATGTTHGAGLLALYPAWLKYEYKYSSEKIDTVANILSGKECCCEDISLDEISKFIDRLEIRKSLSELGLVSTEGLADQVLGNMKNDPAFDEDRVVEKIYRQAFEM